MGFAGQQWDEESGLFYNRHRFYLPEAACYLSPDPLGLAGGENTYSYVSNPQSAIDPLGLAVCSARVRQAKMLKDDVGYNISPKSWEHYPSIGRDGTFVTDKAGALKYFRKIESGNANISSSLAAKIEKDMGLNPGSLQDGFNIRKIEGIAGMHPRSPLSGNSYFLGPGQHLPGGAPEMVINSIPTSTPILLRVNVI